MYASKFLHYSSKECKTLWPQLMKVEWLQPNIESLFDTYTLEYHGNDAEHLPFLIDLAPRRVRASSLAINLHDT